MLLVSLIDVEHSNSNQGQREGGIVERTCLLIPLSAGFQLLPLPLIVRPPSDWAMALASSVGQGLSASSYKTPSHSLPGKIAIFCMDIKSIEKCILDSTLRRLNQACKL